MKDNKRIKAVYLAGGTLTAGGSGDDTAVESNVLDKIDFNTLILKIAFNATLTDTKGLEFKTEYKTADTVSGLSAAAYSTLKANTEVITSDGGGDEGNVLEYSSFDINLISQKKYFKFKITPDLTAANTDTAAWHAIGILADPAIVPSEYDYHSSIS